MPCRSNIYIYTNLVVSGYLRHQRDSISGALKTGITSGTITHGRCLCLPGAGRRVDEFAVSLTEGRRMSQLVETSLVTRLHRIFERIQQRLIDQATIPFEIKLWGGQSSYRFGKGQPVVTVVVKDRNGLLALSGFDEVEICEAYMAGSLDVVGDMLKFVGLRRMLRDSHPLHTLWHRLMPLFIGREQTDRQAIANHYDFSNEFYLSFMDPTRCYSQAVFERDDERLESAQRRKLDFAVESCRLKPGDRVLDIGGGWGAFTEHAGRRGIQVTSLTVSRQSELFMIDLM